MRLVNFRSFRRIRPTSYVQERITIQRVGILQAIGRRNRSRRLIALTICLLTAAMIIVHGCALLSTLAKSQSSNTSRRTTTGMADDDDKTEFNIEGLDKLSKLFAKAGAPVVNVGILGDTARQSSDPKKLTNAQIGAFHEFGTTKVPQRSFIRVPLISEMDKRIKSSGVFNKEMIQIALRAGTLKPIMLQVGVLAEAIVLDAFDTGGFGKWAPLKPSTLANKKNHQILVETQQLRNSITSEVVESDEGNE